MARSSHRFRAVNSLCVLERLRRRVYKNVYHAQRRLFDLIWSSFRTLKGIFQELAGPVSFMAILTSIWLAVPQQVPIRRRGRRKRSVQ